ncbi:cell dividion protein FtsZ [Thiomicrospira aerophila AL3]|uniref:Cell division protein ZipA n=1 Tax=Thiomicrospira aerophila AL3 TaxID=717772 RepID=W0DWP9_9GAMM|nr:cell division protein ZipA C-terminal FtsZ-binding domain-containing protein [Thiomicrospira aerophila]AHF01291.1 cell dividion protein FtsZ [Thiomicrospira aerophila AL3]
MNEMQWILLAFALVVVVAIYFVSQKRSSRHIKTEQEPKQKKTFNIKNQFAKVGISKATENQPSQASTRATFEDKIPSFKADEDLSTHSSLAGQSGRDDADAFDYLQAKLELEAEMEREQDRAASAFGHQSAKLANNQDGPKHKVIEIDDMFPADDTYYPKEVRDGRHNYAEAPSQLEVPLDNSEPETFAILVLSIADEFSIKAIDQVLKTNGLTFNAEAGIFVKKVNNKTVLRVANIFEPGVFPAEWEEGASTAGIAIILQLPTHIKAPRAMDELILTARRVSQSLRGRMYDMERRMIRETDLQAMRERALDYETTRM